MEGIFAQQFDTIAEAEDMAVAVHEAIDAGDRASWRERLWERQHARTALERRGEMLLIERVIDEWSDTKSYLYNRLFRLDRSNFVEPQSLLGRAISGAEDMVLAAADRIKSRRRQPWDPGAPGIEGVTFMGGVRVDVGRPAHDEEE